MTDARLAYDDAATAAQMTMDCRAVAAALRLPGRRSLAGGAIRAVVPPVSNHCRDAHPGHAGDAGVEVSDAAADLAAALHLHLD